VLPLLRVVEEQHRYTPSHEGYIQADFAINHEIVTRKR